ncbi:tRNA -methyltransferase [Erysiphe neolycopersici]|uniref:tRNA (guanine(37)-N1)-methyltransferase n=1 Tax=Erysiphe neolycopersici TaxID=212602 RepID=A0A420HD28_9PEZI|nr:tRNA -methyltransferase [Erysiphe neolycopersici]
MSLFRPPMMRSAANSILDRSLFSRVFAAAAARVLDSKDISRYRNELSKTREILKLDRFPNIRPDPDPEVAAQGGKCVVLNPQVKPEVKGKERNEMKRVKRLKETTDPTTWSPVLAEAVNANKLKVLSYDVKLDYDYWSYSTYSIYKNSQSFFGNERLSYLKLVDIMTSILPEDAQGEIPVGFAIVGHIAHLNLRDEYLSYKNLIAEVLVDKNPQIRTVINKIQDVGEESEFRTFKYEVLAGLDDMKVELSEGGCNFKFDYSKVYWNSRLQTEHKRLIDAFNPGELVVDVMAGIGPFALPAGKKKVFVWANDLNPECYKCLAEGIVRNKVNHFVRPFNKDGREFIQHSVYELTQLASKNKNFVSLPQRQRSRHGPVSTMQIIPLPTVPSHFVMNLPAIAIEFCDSFSGLYSGQDQLFDPYTTNILPMVHVHCFSTKSKDDVKESFEICNRLSEVMKTVLRPRFEAGDLQEGEVRVWNVRDVAPKKRMFCAEFRIPREVAFRVS